VPERSAGLLVPGESGHASAEVGEVPGAVEPTVHAGPHQIERPSATGGDHGHPARVGLLQRLAERLALSRMHEHVEGGQRGGERIPVEPPEEQSVGKLFLQPVPPWPVADDDQTGAGDAVQRGEILHLLLGGEASDVADDDLRSPFRSERVAAPGGVEALRVHPSPPGSESVDAEVTQLLRGFGGRREREGRSPVEPCDMGVGHAGRRGDAIPLRVCGHIGLVGRDRPDAAAFCGEQPAPPEGERRRQVDDIGAEAAELRSDPTGRRRADADIPVSGEWHAADRRDGGTVQPLRDARGGGSEHTGLVPSALQVAEDLHHGSGHAVHVRKEGLGDDRDSHTPRMTVHLAPAARNRRRAPDVHRMLDHGSPAIRALVPVHRLGAGWRGVDRPAR